MMVQTDSSLNWYLTKNQYHPAPYAAVPVPARLDLKSHESSHTSQSATDYSDDVSLVCQVCHKSCRSLGGSKRCFNSMHKELPVTRMSSSKGHTCNICGFLSKSSSGLKSHLRAHHRNRAQRTGGASRQHANCRHTRLRVDSHHVTK